MRIRVRAFARLHFGLMEICPNQPHCFGGIGVMIDSSVSELVGTLGWISDADPAIDAPLYWRDRILTAARRWKEQTGSSRFPVRALSLSEPPIPHVGLGSGTQLACSVAMLLEAASRSHDPKAEDSRFVPPRAVVRDAQSLARLCGRGKRSHIGAEGFVSGGWIVDWGQDRIGPGTDTPRTCVAQAPPAWRLVTLCDASYEGESGLAEEQVFAKCASLPNPDRNTMIALIRDGWLPALREGNWEAASSAIGEYGTLAGKIFSPLQGGVFRSPKIAEYVSLLNASGVRGAGQSSWGPTVFGLAKDSDHADWMVRVLRTRIPEQTQVRIAAVAGPAQIQWDEES